jgi:hypothetical protein
MQRALAAGLGKTDGMQYSGRNTMDACGCENFGLACPG